MGFVETERRGQVMVIRMNRPERLNALGQELRAGLAEAWREFRDSDDLEIAIFTGTGRAFCAGEDMKESVERGTVGGGRRTVDDPFMNGTLTKPVIAAVNGFAMGGGFQLVERTDLRVAVEGAVFEIACQSAPELRYSDGYLTVDLGPWHFHLCLGPHKGSTSDELRRNRPVARVAFFERRGKGCGNDRGKPDDARLYRNPPHENWFLDGPTIYQASQGLFQFGESVAT